MSFLTGELMNAARGDVLNFGTALLGSRAGEHVFDVQPHSPLHPYETLTNNTDWVKSSLLTLIGFAVYELLVRRYINTDGVSQNKGIKLALDDLLKFGTMYIAYRLMTREPLNDANWVKEVTYILAGLMSYDFVVRYGVKSVYDTSKLSVNAQMAVDDTVKYTTMFVVSRWLSGKAFDKEWAVTAGGFVVGAAAYDYLLA